MEVECEMYSCGKTYCSNSKNDCDYLIYIEALLKGSRKQEKKQKKTLNLNSFIIQNFYPKSENTFF